MSDVKAGGAYIELGAKDVGWNAAMKRAEDQFKGFQDKLKKFADGLTAVGKKLGIAGGAIVGGMFAAAKSTANLAEETDNLRVKTGLSLEAIAGLKKQAEDSGLSAASLGTAFRTLQAAIVSPSQEAEEALQALGISFGQLKALSPEAQFGLIADQMNKLGTEAERSTAAQALFGRSGTELLPVLAGGSAGMNESIASAKKLGLAFNEETIRKALKMDEAFDQMEQQLKGVAIAIGNAVIPAVLPLVQGINQILASARAWIDANPEMIQSFFDIGAAIAAAGAAFLALGATFAALASPAIVIAGTMMLIGSALMAVLDVAGVTKTGFGELFNSIRIEGTGLGTWLGIISAKIGQAFDHALDAVLDAFRALYAGVVVIGNGIFQVMIFVPRKIVDAFNGMANLIEETLNALIAGINLALRGLGAEPIKFRFSADHSSNILADTGDAMEGFAQRTQRDFFTGRDERARVRKQKDRLVNQDIALMQAKDPNDGSSGFSFSLDRAKSAVAGIGGNIGEALKGILEKFKFEMPSGGGAPEKKPFGAPTGQKAPGFGGPKPKAGAADQGVDRKVEFSSVGTFSGFVGGGLAAAGVFNQQLAVQREIAKNTGKMAGQEAGGGLGA